MHAGRVHDGEDGEGGFQVTGCYVGVDEHFVLADVEDCLAVAEDAEDVRCELGVAVAGGGVEDVEADAVGWV